MNLSTTAPVYRLNGVEVPFAPSDPAAIKPFETIADQLNLFVRPPAPSPQWDSKVEAEFAKVTWSATGRLNRLDLLRVAGDPGLTSEQVALVYTLYSRYDSLAARNQGQFFDAGDVRRVRLGGMYKETLETRVDNVSTKLVAADGIDYRAFCQEQTPECYAETVITGLAQRNAAWFSRTMTQADGRISVRFPAGDQVDMPEPTPAQQLIIGGAGRNGLWGTAAVIAWSIQARHVGPAGDHGDEEVVPMALFTNQPTTRDLTSGLALQSAATILSQPDRIMTASTYPLPRVYSNGLTSDHSYLVEKYCQTGAATADDVVVLRNVNRNALMPAQTYVGEDMGHGEIKTTLGELLDNFMYIETCPAQERTS